MERLDVLMAEKGLAESRQKAKELILQGQVSVNGRVCTKPSFSADGEDDIKITGEPLKYVGRGGLKLEKIMTLCNIDVRGNFCMDIGASTGGFTDCLLQSGAETVYAVDVGSGQLAERLRMDSRVINMEKTDIRNIEASSINVLPDFISVDVSFISLKLILQRVYDLLSPKGTAAVLIKPQFEAGRENVGKNGIVKSKKVHLNVLKDILSFAENIGFILNGICYSPVTGSKGNIEYLMCLKKHGIKVGTDLEQLVDEAFSILKPGGSL